MNSVESLIRRVHSGMVLIVALGTLAVIFCGASSYVQSSPQSSNPGNAGEVLHEICAAICSQSPGGRELTFVFVLFTTRDFETSFNYLWSLPRAQIFLSTEPMALKTNDREITVSWERDDKPPGSNREVSAFWDIYKHCGSRNCDHVIDTIEHFQMEKRVLIQVRELKTSEWIRYTPQVVRDRMKTLLDYTFYYHRYRSTLVVLRLKNAKNVHSSLIIKRSGKLIGKTIMQLDIKELSVSDAKKVFDPVQRDSNRSSEYGVLFSGLTFPDGGSEHIVAFNSCNHNRITYAYAYTYLAVRLAVPLPWETHLVSKLPQYSTLELPLTIVSLIALPWVLSIRRYRSFTRVSSVLRASYHLLSGDNNDSIISSSQQGHLTLLLCGLVSLLIQFPISLLKGEVISSSYEQRIHPSQCSINTCETSEARWKWFDRQKDYSDGFNIMKLDKASRNNQGSVTETNLRSGCSTISLSTAGMFKWTKLAFLAQYHTLCNDPELMKLQLNNFGRNLVFEPIVGSHASQPICLLGSSHGGHVLFDEAFKISKQILEHGLLRYHHVNASLYPDDPYEAKFWNRERMRKNWGSPESIKRTVQSIIANLEKRYHDLGMLGNGESFKAVGFQSVELLIVTLLGLMVAYLMGILLSKYSADSSLG